MTLPGPGYSSVLGRAGDLHFDGPPRPLPVDLQEKLLLPLWRDEILLPAPARGHQEKEVQGTSPHSLGQIEDESDIGLILAGEGVVDLKIDLAAQTLYTLQGRLKASLAADQIMLLRRCAVQADADPRYAGGSNLVCHLRCDAVVPLLAKETRRPKATPWRAIRKISGRSKGSPPLKMSMGCKGAMLSRKESASSVESSSASGREEAEARQ